MLSMIEKDTMFCWLQLKLDLVSITKSKYKLERTSHKKKTTPLPQNIYTFISAREYGWV